MRPLSVTVGQLPHPVTYLTVHANYREPDRMPSELLLLGRPRVDPARHTSVRRPDC